MKRSQNVIIFSAGESVRNGNVEYFKNKLLEKNIQCFDWRSLFSYAHDIEHIALLPALSKKIPTFDFALIIAEGVDTVKLRGGEELSVIRDNVIFELGLCIMALGRERVILLAEESVRIPEDLIGVGKIGIEYITFQSFQDDVSVDKISQFIQKSAEVSDKRFTTQLERIVNHISLNSELISPVVVGAAVSSAEAYFLNFIIRLLENINNGFAYSNNPEMVFDFPEEFKMIIYIPTRVDSLTSRAISDFYFKKGFDEFLISDAGMRGLYFNGFFDENKILTIVDIPTSITASFSVVNSVLNLDSDDEYDNLAEERFVVKEMDMYAFALNKLLTPKVATERLSFIKDENKRKKVINLLKNVHIESINISDCDNEL